MQAVGQLKSFVFNVFVRIISTRDGSCVIWMSYMEWYHGGVAMTGVLWPSPMLLMVPVVDGYYNWQAEFPNHQQKEGYHSGWWFHFFVHLYLGKWSNLTNIFHMGWNHQPVLWCWKIKIQNATEIKYVELQWPALSSGDIWHLHMAKISSLILSIPTWFM